jgi:hypothetical protein
MTGSRDVPASRSKKVRRRLIPFGMCCSGDGSMRSDVFVGLGGVGGIEGGMESILKD